MKEIYQAKAADAHLSVKYSKNPWEYLAKKGRGEDFGKHSQLSPEEREGLLQHFKRYIKEYEVCDRKEANCFWIHVLLGRDVATLRQVYVMLCHCLLVLYRSLSLFPCLAEIDGALQRSTGEMYYM